MLYSADWQLLEERIDDDYALNGNFNETRRVQYFWGARGTDDIILHRADTNFNGVYNRRFYHLTDTQFSTIVILNENAVEQERVTYDAYGRIIHHKPPGDILGTGMVISADIDAWTAIVQNPQFFGGVGTIADLNRDGLVDVNDRGIISANLGRGLPRGRMSFAFIDNPIGWKAYHFHPELQIYLARHRWFDPELGRWLQRDPAGYVDGMNLYLYGLGSPFVFVDPYGLSSWWNPGSWFRRKSCGGDPVAQQIALARAREEGKIGPGQSPYETINEMLSDSEVRQQISEYEREVMAGAMEGAAEGLGHGGIMLANEVTNIATFGLYTPLQDRVDGLIDAYGGTYQFANNSMRAGTTMLATATGFGAISRSGQVVNQETTAARGMNNPTIRAAVERGREVHRQFADRVRQKAGWRANPTVKGGGRPDALSRTKRPVELKPNTPTGRAKGARQIEKYEDATGKKGRVIYYDP